MRVSLAVMRHSRVVVVLLRCLLVRAASSKLSGPSSAALDGDLGRGDGRGQQV